MAEFEIKLQLTDTIEHCLELLNDMQDEAIERNERIAHLEAENAAQSGKFSDCMALLGDRQDESVEFALLRQKPAVRGADGVARLVAALREHSLYRLGHLYYCGGCEKHFASVGSADFHDGWIAHVLQIAGVTEEGND